MSAGRSRFLLVASLWTLGAGRSAAADHPADQQALVQRLEESAVRLRALEQTVRLQAEQLAEERRRLDTLLAQLCPAASAAVGAPLGRPKTQGRTFQRVEAPPERPVTHRAVSFGLGGLVQGWYVAGDHGQRDTFRVRRTELYFSGQITEKGRWLIMVDPAKALSLEQSFTSLGEAPAAAGVTVNQASRILQNAQVTFDYIPRMQVTIGQFKVPLSREGLESSGRLDTIERALFASDRARGGAYGDVRDIGLMVNGLLGPRVDYHLGVFNGVVESQNDVDRDEFRRLGNGRGERPRRDRIGGEVQLVKGPFTVRSELMAGWDGAVSRRGSMPSWVIGRTPGSRGSFGSTSGIPTPTPRPHRPRRPSATTWQA